ncbi:MAG: hypothetical protein H7X91_05235 [Burkholderiales bacterium]|nr:hypothetical protein [Burkholderiales bacterium]
MEVTITALKHKHPYGSVSVRLEDERMLGTVSGLEAVNAGGFFLIEDILGIFDPPDKQA